ncbi:MAG: hypothetical protein HOL75_07350 [Nitrospina sp.]|nr:hypothetical protein [Nitrospina sp.]
MNKILCVGFIFFSIFVFLSLSFAEPELHEQTQSLRSFLKEAQTVVSSDRDFSLISKETNEVSVTAILPDYPWIRVSDYRGFLTEKCVSCHRGISQIGKAHPLSFGCTVCHGGDGSSDSKEAAHLTLIYDPEAKTGKRNPSSFNVVDKTCGQAYCHSGHPQKDRNHIERVKKSIMGNLAGMISGLRYQWGAQIGRKANYGVNIIQDNDGDVPLSEGALLNLKALPLFSNKESTPRNSERLVSHHIADRILKDKCFQCHIDSPGKPGTFRSQGCAACHFTYSEDGLYKGEDPTISKVELGHPKKHRMITLTPDSICRQCHQGFRESQSDAPFENGLSDGKIRKKSIDYFPGFGKIKQDVHLEAGFECIDCHTQFDIMGDGNIYSKQHQAVEVRCETCHGDTDSRPLIDQIKDPLDRVVRLASSYTGWSNSVGDWMVVSSRQRKLTNVKVEKNSIVTLGKRTGNSYRTPLTVDALENHNIPGHKNNLECTSCHSQWVPNCKGCHSNFMSERDKRSNLIPDAMKQFDVQSPSLMVGPRGKVVPMIAPERRLLNILDEQGNFIPVMEENGDTTGIYREWSFTNSHGYSGGRLAYAMNPHSIGKKVRSCESCHMSTRALGLGEGDIQIGLNSTGKDDKIVPLVRTDIISGRSQLAPKARLTMRGEPLAGISQPGARLFNQEEINRILKVGNCLPCHEKYNDPIYQDIRKSYLFEKTLDHRTLRASILGQ